VVDPGSLLVFLASIALATYFLRYALVVKLGRRRRDVGLGDIFTGRTGVLNAHDITMV
jgi:hypothetical protein